MIDNISEKEITTREGLERIDYLLIKSLCLYDFIDQFYKKEEVTDYFNRLYQELKSLTNTSTLLKTYPSPTELKDNIEAIFTTLNDIYYKSESFNLSDEKINEMKTLLNTLLDAVYVEIGNRMCEEFLKD